MKSPSTVMETCLCIVITELSVLVKIDGWMVLHVFAKNFLWLLQHFDPSKANWCTDSSISLILFQSKIGGEKIIFKFPLIWDGKYDCSPQHCYIYKLHVKFNPICFHTQRLPIIFSWCFDRMFTGVHLFVFFFCVYKWQIHEWYLIWPK